MSDWIAALPHASPSIEHAAAWVTWIMGGLALLGWALDLALPAMRRRAEATESLVDDRIVGWLGTVAAVLGVLSAIIPRPRLGERQRGGEQ